jgi:hypothetical protein
MEIDYDYSQVSSDLNTLTCNKKDRHGVSSIGFAGRCGARNSRDFQSKLSVQEPGITIWILGALSGFNCDVYFAFVDFL